jgi:hypothetical protein
MSDPSISPGSDESAAAAGQLDRHAMQSTLAELIRTVDAETREPDAPPPSKVGSAGRQALAALADEVAYASAAAGSQAGGEAPPEPRPESGSQAMSGRVSSTESGPGSAPNPLGPDGQPIGQADRSAALQRARLRALRGESDMPGGHPANGGSPAQAGGASSPLRPIGRVQPPSNGSAQTRPGVPVPPRSGPMPGPVKLSGGPPPPPPAPTIDQPTIALRRRPVVAAPIMAQAPEQNHDSSVMVAARATTIEGWLPSDDDILPRLKLRRGRAFRRVR